MIKKFEEYISEDFWKTGIQRAKSNNKRMENKFPESFYKEKDLHEVIGFDGYFISIGLKKHVCNLYVYHEPNPEHIEVMQCDMFMSFNKECPQFEWYGDLNHSDFLWAGENTTDEEFDTIYTDEFVEAVNTTLKNIWSEKIENEKVK